MHTLHKDTLPTRTPTRPALNIIFIALACGASLYSVKISFSPIYALVGLSSFILLIARLGPRFQITADSAIALTLLTYIIFRVNGKDGTYINAVLAYLAYIAIISYKRLIKNQSAAKFLIAASWFSLVILLSDSVYRLLHPTPPQAETIQSLQGTSNALYLYKFGSLMFADSNTTGLVAICLLAALLKIKLERYRVSNLLLIGYFILITSTLSRAAIIGMITLLLLYKYKLSVKSLTYATAASVGIICYFLIQADGSLLSKFFVYELISNHIESSNATELVFGVGPGNATALLGMHTHILPATYFVELGAIGLILFLAFMISATFSSPNMYVMSIPIMVVSMSYFLYLGAPFLTIPLALASIVRYPPPEKGCFTK